MINFTTKIYYMPLNFKSSALMLLNANSQFFILCFYCNENVFLLALEEIIRISTVYLHHQLSRKERYLLAAICSFSFELEKKKWKELIVWRSLDVIVVWSAYDLVQVFLVRKWWSNLLDMISQPHDLKCLPLFNHWLRFTQQTHPNCKHPNC